MNRAGGVKNDYKIKPALCHSDKPLWARGLCKNCYDKDLKSRNPEYAERQRQNNKEWVEKHKEKQKLYIKDWRAKKDPEWNRARSLKRYGITPNEYDSMLEKQNGVCAICLAPPKNKRLAVDHCHETGFIRGLLCFRCNFGLKLL